ncbi:MAG: aldo/keto reductase [Myxococcales bacterium]|nr:aldo/keto reductase [Myxococcales bacterium]
MSATGNTGPTVELRGVAVPRFIYGTAWKEARTEELTRLAIEQGFRAIDTANQRKHYVEADVGRAVAAAIAEGRVDRGELFLQTKFTYRRGQDERLPYDPRAPLAKQVRQSFERSQQHLRSEVIDSYLLHGPSAGSWNDDDREVWHAMEALHDEGRARLLGVSNVSRGHLETLCAEARVPPAFVQNRCYAEQGWDADVRAFCRRHGIVYQGFSLLTANRRALQSPAFGAIVRRTGFTPSQLVFRAAIELGILPVTGTSSVAHMQEDLAVQHLELSDADRRAIEAIAS